MNRWFSIALAWAIAVAGVVAADEEAPAQSSVEVRVVSPRFAAEVPFGEDKITIVVEVEDATEGGIKIKKGIPVFEPPVYKDGTVNEVVKGNVDLFLKNLVAVTTYTRQTKPLGRTATIYQLTSVVRTALLGGGCSLAVAPKEIPPGVRELPAAGYKAGAEFEFRVGNSPMESKRGDVFSSDLCLVVASAP